MAQVLAVKTGTLKPAQRKLLDKHEIVVIEMEDPQELRFIRVESGGLESDDLTWAAIAAIDECGVALVAQKFTANVRSILARKIRAKATQPEGTKP